MFLNMFPRYYTSHENYTIYKVHTTNNFGKRENHSEIKATNKSVAEKPPEMNHCEVIHIGIVTAGYKSNFFLHTLFKSILFYRVNPIHLHLLVDQTSRHVLDTLFKTWLLPNVEVTFYDINRYIDEVKWVPNAHYSGKFGMVKLVFPNVVPLNVTKKLIVLDTDITFVSDIYELWQLFDRFTRKQAIGIVENESDYYLGLLGNKKPWPAIGRGFNSGLMLYNLERLKEFEWPKLWMNIAKQTLRTYEVASLGDQDIINTVLLEYPDLLYQVPCMWNTQLSDHTLSYECYKNNKIKTIHWNSPFKFKVQNRDGSYFRNLYTTFVEHNGNLLRQQLQLCGFNASTLLPPKSEGLCSHVLKPAQYPWRTHLFFIDFKYTPIEHDVTLVAQLSFDRLKAIEELFNMWTGPISLTFYVSDAELNKVISFIEQSEVLSRRTNVAYHAVFSDGDFYPINMLRNVGLRNVITPYVFLTDIDFIPMINLYESIRNYIINAKEMIRKALIVPAFQFAKERITTKMPFNLNKEKLLRLWQSKTITPFLEDVWRVGHEPTDFERWKLATNSYYVKWKPDFEPYIVVRSNVVRYNESFIGFGWNKVSHIMELEAQDYDFIVLPDAFIVHKAHPPSGDIVKFRASSEYQVCINILKEQFIEKLNRQYGRSFRHTNFTKAYEKKRRKRNFVIGTTEENNTDYPFLSA